jgi:HEPN domain-containing protein
MNEIIFDLMSNLKKKGRSDLANLIKGSRYKIEETTQYGSYWNKYLSGFHICAPVEQYRELEKLTKCDQDLILECILDIYPKSEDLEIGFINFKILQNEKQLSENISLARSWLIRSKNKFDEGETLIQKWSYAEAISSFQECIELSLKAIFLFLTDKYPKSHEFKDKEFKEILNKVPKSLKHLESHKLFLYSMFWANFYTISKYGLENFGIGAEKLFAKEEAELAKKHAYKCLSAAQQLGNYLENPW